MVAHVHLPQRVVVYPAGNGERRVQSAQTVVELRGVRDGAGFDRLVSALRGGIVVSEWVAQQPPSERPFLIGVIQLLDARGVLEDGPAQRPDVVAAQAQYLELYGNGRGAHARLAASRVVLAGSGVSLAETALGLARVGVGHLKLLGDGWVDELALHQLPWLMPDALGHSLPQQAALALGRRYPRCRVSHAFFNSDRDSVQSELTKADLLLHVPDGHRPRARRRLNDASLAANVPLLARLQVGFEVAVGPVVFPDEGPCLRCLDHRLHSNMQSPLKGPALDAALSAHARSGQTALSIGVEPIGTGIDLLCSEAIAVLSGGRPPELAGHVALLGVGRAEVRRHQVLRVPRCKGCGPEHLQRPRIDARSGQ